ncbi:MAG: M20/M25/M40 family metallo-hydrolase [Candidatus Atribacteria bacterium]|nr:MAG: M20/M25/M40 family metallo-hydrolase [Candidatus Atribacteria bacterium]
MSQRTATTILQDLIRFDTTNPPGNERACIDYLDQLLQSVGIETSILAKDPERPNLLARIPGAGTAPGLLLFGHVDVVTTAHQHWSVPPFEGRITDGMLWGRGALDMKAGIAMMTSALLEAKSHNLQPAGDILFAAVSDEEAGGTMGAKYLVAEHPSLFEGVRYALGEFGGFPLYIDGRPLYMIQVGEKQPCWAEVTLRGPGGHGARPMRDGAMARLGHVLTTLNQRRLPVHITPITERMVRAMADALPRHKAAVFRRLLNPRLTDRILRLLGETGRNLEPLFRNTVNATIVRGGEKPNVIPSEILLGLDGRLLPGFEPDDLFRELETILGERLDAKVLLHDRGTADCDLGLFALLADVLKQAHPGSYQVPYLLPGSSDARFFSQLGIQTYGFTPMNLSSGFDFFETIHAADERIPVEAVEFGAKSMLQVITRYGQRT